MGPLREPQVGERPRYAARERDPIDIRNAIKPDRSRAAEAAKDDGKTARCRARRDDHIRPLTNQKPNDLNSEKQYPERAMLVRVGYYPHYASIQLSPIPRVHGDERHVFPDKGILHAEKLCPVAPTTRYGKDAQAAHLAIHLHSREVSPDSETPTRPRSASRY